MSIDAHPVDDACCGRKPRVLQNPAERRATPDAYRPKAQSGVEANPRPIVKCMEGAFHRYQARNCAQPYPSICYKTARRSWTCSRGPGDEPIDHRAQALQLALAIRARSDMGFGRGSLTRRQDLQGVGTRYLVLPAGVKVWARAHTPQTTTASSWMGPLVAAWTKRAPSAGRRRTRFRQGCADKRRAGEVAHRRITRRGLSEGYPWCW
jgi:hypothetical protein